MDNYLEQGRNITTALNELDKFFIEIDVLKNLLINTLDKFLDSSTNLKLRIIKKVIILQIAGI